MPPLIVRMAMTKKFTASETVLKYPRLRKRHVYQKFDLCRSFLAHAPPNMLSEASDNELV